MNCHFCNREAVDRCFSCGELFCEEHGRVDCRRCETAIAPGDCRQDRVSARPLSPSARPGWWRPQPAEDFDPPACYECKGLARVVCRNCGSYYCWEHAGKNGLCAECARSSRIGTLILLIIFGLIAGMVVLSWLEVQLP